MQGFTQVQPLQRVKGLRPARSYCSVENYNGEAQSAATPRAYSCEMGSRIVFHLGFSLGVYMSTHNLGLHEDKSESYQLLQVRDLLSTAQVILICSRLGLRSSSHLQGFSPVAPGLQVQFPLSTGSPSGPPFLPRVRLMMPLEHIPIK
jgi:hypothetical protein